jgi:uncharacterized membrane protein
MQKEVSIMGNYYDMSPGWFVFKSMMFVGGAFIFSLIFWMTGRYVMQGNRHQEQSESVAKANSKKGKKR